MSDVTDTELDLDVIEAQLSGFAFDRNEWTPRILALIARVRELEQLAKEQQDALSKNAAMEFLYGETK